MTLTERFITEQLAAVPNPLYEVGVLTCDHVMLNRTWDAQSIHRSIGWLSYQNATGAHIYIRPAAELADHPYSLVDDLTKDAVRKMMDTGHQPAAIIETSPGNFQAWLNHGEVLPHDVSTAAARRLAQDFGGDVKAADYRHFGRLAGFTNRKDKHATQHDGKITYPWVKLIHASGKVYDWAPALLQTVRAELERAQRQMAETAARFAGVQPGGAHKTIEDFRRDPRYQGDGNRIDQAYALYAISHNVSAADVRAAIASRDLAKKGPPRQQSKYIDRTISKAIEGLGR